VGDDCVLYVQRPAGVCHPPAYGLVWGKAGRRSAHACSCLRERSWLPVDAAATALKRAPRPAGGERSARCSPCPSSQGHSRWSSRCKRSLQKRSTGPAALARFASLEDGGLKLLRSIHFPPTPPSSPCLSILSFLLAPLPAPSSARVLTSTLTPAAPPNARLTVCSGGLVHAASSVDSRQPLQRSADVVASYPLF
jgi:hypothetical protein